MGVGHGEKDRMGSAVVEELLVVVVLSHNKRDQTLRCLESVQRLHYRPLEVLVVDNASTDGSAEAIATGYPQVRLIRSPVNRGAAGGRNLGAEYANQWFSPAYLLFLDDDAVVDPRLAGELVAVMRADSRVGLATPKAYRYGTHDVIASAGGMRVRLGSGSVTDIGAGARDVGQFDEGGLVDSCVGFTVLARSEAFERCRGFDERYNPYGWEEVDLSLRIREAGYTVRYTPAAICWHAGGTPGRGRRVLRYERGKIANYLKLMRRHASVREWLGFLAVVPLRAAGLIAANITGLARQIRHPRT
jgi:GT2 family glycosyltransferase